MANNWFFFCKFAFYFHKLAPVMDAKKQHNRKAQRMNRKPQIAIFASGNGTNAQQIAEYFAEHRTAEVNIILYNRKEAYVATRAKNLGIEALYFKGKEFYENDAILQLLKSRGVDYIVLAGFLLKVPDYLLEAYPERIINIHPALLPNYGGKGMFGMHVHEAVIANHEKQSGITIHIIDNRYDCGTTLFQAHCTIAPEDSADDLAAKIHLLEKAYFPPVIEAFILGTPMPKEQSI